MANPARFFRSRAFFLDRLIVLGLCLALCGNATLAAELGPPPTFPRDLAGLKLPTAEKAPGGVEVALAGPLSVNPLDREASRKFFNTYYLGAITPTIDWTGNRSTCNAGATSLSFRDAVLLRINYFRAMAGVPAQVAFSDTYSTEDQQAALMMSVNNQLNHSPPTSWTCYSAAGAEAAGKSNLALGASGWDAISLYLKDPGTGNGFAGHRRWILYPQTQHMGTGDLPPTGGTAANALWVIDEHIWDPRPATREEYVAWPPPGYVPYQVVYPRWSFAYANADFSGAAVSMTENGVAVSVALETVATGYGENTLVWIPKGMGSGDVWPKPSKDNNYRVTLSNVVIGGTPRSFTYTVKVIDPSTATRRTIAPWWLLLGS